MKINLNHQKLTQEWCKHCKGRFRKMVKKRRRSFIKKVQKEMEDDF